MKNTFSELEKFLEFTYTDLGNIVGARKEELIKWLLVGVEFNSATLFEDTEKSLPAIQRQVLSLLKRLDQSIMQARMKYTIRREKGYSIDSSNSQEIVWAERVSTSMDCVIGQEGCWDFPFSDYKISTKSLIQDQVSLAVECRFFQAADGLSVDALRTCPECNHYFIHISKKQKTYCSNLCAAKAGSRQKRADLKSEKGEAYECELREGAKRARKSYVKKAQGGNPRIKVKRRPTKHKTKKED
ncbi:MAG: hypothetical protein H8E41_01315 [Desulfobulbaceae bacterium]|uniref:Uncharacterized protein n=1 Tax=Candidatus Desulfobia pelagia TaxID=2841692 RepID=A0A8J6NB86_9BACT|nr:hypothetical protein [Candidatus Desulfobia pelagia]